MTIDPRTPVLVGCAQLTLPSDDLDPAEALGRIEPLAMMEEAARAAAEDAGAPALLREVDSIRIPHGLWRYDNPAFQLAARLGVDRCETGLAPISGSSVQIMLSRGALDIRAGRRDAVLLASAECEHWKRRVQRAGGELPAWAGFGAFDPQDGTADIPPPDLRFGGEAEQPGWWERQYRMQAVQGFALYENEMRHQRGEGLAEHRARIAALWARLARIAADNPHAWIRTAPSAKAIAEVSPSNQMVSYPYTKLMVANISVNQAAALILCSVAFARRHGVAEDRMVFPHASAEATRSHEISHRPDLHSQPVIGLVGRKAQELAGVSSADIDVVDLYSCFPAAVQMGAAELGLSLDRDLSVTGGLTFAGGPLNSYVMHSIAATVNRLRTIGESGGARRALVSSIGGFVAKHAVAIYGTAPPGGAGFRHESVDDAALALPRRELLHEYAGPAVVESFAVANDREGVPERMLLSCGAPDGERVWAETRERAVLDGAGVEEVCGRAVEIDAAGTAHVR